jgi:hypothetical protein
MLANIKSWCNVTEHYRLDSARKQPVQTPTVNQGADYHASLLRLWREGPEGAWRASLQDAESGERIGFADLERLFAHLRWLTHDTPDGSDRAIITER